MKLNTGKIAFAIEFDNGEKDNIYFNPNDPNLSIRMKDFQKKVTDRIDKLDQIKLSAKGEPEDIDKIEEFRELQSILFEELDYAFGGDISEAVFRYCSPFAIVDGDYFIMQFLNGIKPEIEKVVKANREKAEERMQKHIAKYQNK